MPIFNNDIKKEFGVLYIHFDIIFPEFVNQE